MIKTIHIQFDYLCFPLWPFDENGQEEPAEDIEVFMEHPDLYERFYNLQEWYNCCWESESGYFFETDAERQAFLKEWHEAMDEFIKHADGRYEIISHFNEFKA